MNKAAFLTLLTLPALHAEEPRPVDEVTQSAIQSAFQVLRSEYIRANELTFDELNRAALQGLLDRLALGAELIAKADAEKPADMTGVLAETLTPEIAYLRPLSFTEGEVVQMEKKLAEFHETRVPHLILDLRSAAPPGEFAVAAAMLDLFVPRGELLFKLKQTGRETADLYLSNRAPVWTNPLVVLIDSETCNLGEAIAAVLQHRRQALLTGSPTRGATVRYETIPIDEAWLLRFARAEMLLGDGTSLFKTGLKPAFAVSLPLEDKRKVFDAAGRKSPVKNTIFDKARLRYNEAALVARKNPELEAYIKRSAGASTQDDRPALHDVVLQRAVDMIGARLHLQSARIDWSRKSAEPRPTTRKAQPVPNP